MYTILLLSIVAFIALLISKFSDREVWLWFGGISGALCCLLLLFYIMSRACSNIALQKYENERDAITYRLEHNIDPVKTVTDAESFNNKILMARRAYENPWINFLGNGDSAMRIDLIDIENITITVEYNRKVGK